MRGKFSIVGFILVKLLNRNFINVGLWSCRDSDFSKIIRIGCGKLDKFRLYLGKYDFLEYDVCSRICYM